MKREKLFENDTTLPALKYKRPRVKKSERAKCPWKFAYKDKVVCKTLALYEPKYLDGKIVGVWFDARNIENFYAVKLDGYPAEDYPYPVVVFPESHIRKLPEKEE